MNDAFSCLCSRRLSFSLRLLVIACPTCFMSLKAIIQISEYMSSLFLEDKIFLDFLLLTQ